MAHRWRRADDVDRGGGHRVVTHRPRGERLGPTGPHRPRRPRPAVRLVRRLIPAVDAGLRREGLLRLWLEPGIETVARSGSRPRSGILRPVITEGSESDVGD